MGLPAELSDVSSPPHHTPLNLTPSQWNEKKIRLHTTAQNSGSTHEVIGYRLSPLSLFHPLLTNEQKVQYLLFTRKCHSCPETLVLKALSAENSM